MKSRCVPDIVLSVFDRLRLVVPTHLVMLESFCWPLLILVGAFQARRSKQRHSCSVFSDLKHGPTDESQYSASCQPYGP